MNMNNTLSNRSTDWSTLTSTMSSSTEARTEEHNLDTSKRMWHVPATIYKLIGLGW